MISRRNNEARRSGFRPSDSSRVLSFGLHHILLLGLFAMLALGGCTTKAKAKADARAAFLAGQQQGMMRTQQAQTPTVTLHGAVRNPLIPWTQDLTVARAIIAAEYYGPGDPREIILVRQGMASRIDPNKLLTGEDPPVYPGDILELR